MTSTVTASEQRLLDSLEREHVVSLLQDLIRIPSVVNVDPEQAVADCAAGYLSERGLDVALEPVLPDRPNVVARVGPAGGKRLLFNAHMDVVAAGGGWSVDPFAGALRDGRVYGRGAVDDKGPLAAMMAAAAALAGSGARINGQLVLCAVVDEENCSQGSKHLMRHLRGDMGIVGEPTNGNIVIAHKGSLRPLIKTTGRVAHTSRPETGINAISKMARVVQAIDALHLELRRRAHPLTGAASAAVSRIQAGVGDNVIPDTCSALLDRRLIPGETEAEALAELESLFARLKAEDPDLTVSIDRLVPTTGGAAEVSPDAQVVVLLRQCAEAVLGRRPALTGLGGACDMVHLVDAGVPTVVFGPGDDRQAHQPDEHIEVEQLLQCARVYLLAALRFLG
jgi:acetylornithine deacetylase/succinyl-diaminopimelate desuccinylase family protein